MTSHVVLLALVAVVTVSFTTVNGYRLTNIILHERAAVGSKFTRVGGYDKASKDKCNHEAGEVFHENYNICCKKGEIVNTNSRKCVKPLPGCPEGQKRATNGYHQGCVKDNTPHKPPTNVQKVEAEKV